VLLPLRRALSISDIEFVFRLIYRVSKSHAVAASSQSLPAHSSPPIRACTKPVQAEGRDQSPRALVSLIVPFAWFFHAGTHAIFHSHRSAGNALV
jgi:hypothetical protein